MRKIFNPGHFNTDLSFGPVLTQGKERAFFLIAEYFSGINNESFLPLMPTSDQTN